MKNTLKKICMTIVATILVMWIWNQIFPHQQSDTYKTQLISRAETVYDTPAAPDGYSKMNGFYHTSLTEQGTCATNRFPIGTKVSIWCGIDAERGSSSEATVVSNQVHTNTVDTIELSEDINDFFAGGTTMYAVWVKEV
jgi:hypothetical protein